VDAAKPKGQRGGAFAVRKDQSGCPPGKGSVKKEVRHYLLP